MPFHGVKRAVILSLVCSAGLILLAGGAADGALVTIGIAGDVTFVSDPTGVLEGKINVYDTFTGFYKYDSGAVDRNPLNSAIGDYQFNTAPFGISLDMGGLHFASDPQNVNFNIEVSHDNGSMDRYLISSANNLPLENGAVVGQILWQLEYNNSSTLTSDALPLAQPDLYDLTSNVFRIDGGAMHIRAEIYDAYFIPEVPEPATAMLLGFGAIVFLRRKSWRLF